MLPLAVALCALCLSGCANWQKKPEVKYQTVAASNSHDTATAKEKHAEALVFLECLDRPRDFRKAEKLLNEALVADVTYGPAHNSLGHLYYLQDKLYLAAWEFEYAAKLMPEMSEPLNNLGLVYERAGKYEEAISYYSMALSHCRNDPVVLGNLVRVRLTTGDRSGDLKHMISDLALYHPSREWRNWARDQVHLAKFDEECLGPENHWQTDEPPATAPPPATLPTPLEEVNSQDAPEIDLQLPDLMLPNGVG